MIPIALPACPDVIARECEWVDGWALVPYAMLFPIGSTLDLLG